MRHETSLREGQRCQSGGHAGGLTIQLSQGQGRQPRVREGAPSARGRATFTSWRVMVCVTSYGWLRRVSTLFCPCFVPSCVDLLYFSPSFLWWQGVAGILGVTSRHALRMNSRGTWRHREGARKVHNPTLRRALTPSQHAGGSRPVSTAAPEAWHRCGATPRAGTPRRPYTGGATTQSLPHPCDAMSARRSSFRLPAMASL